MNVDKVAIGQRIRSRREYLGILQREMAKLLSMTRVNYGKIEAGHVNITAEDLSKLALALKVQPGYFYGDDETEESPEDRDVIMFYRGIRPDMQPAALAALRGLYERFRAEDDEGTTGKKAE